MILRVIAVSMLAFAVPGLTLAGDLTRAQRTAVLEEAHTAYARGLEQRAADPAEAKASFERAVNRFGVLVDDGQATGPLLYNLGNAQVQAGRIGPAIATYLRAESRMPGDPRLAENLAHARSLVRTRVDADGGTALIDRLLFWHHAWSPAVRLVVFAFAWFLLWGMLTVRCWRRVPGMRAATVVAGVASLLLGLSLTWPLIAGETPIGVLVQDDVIVRKGDSAAFEPRFAEPIHQGVEFRVLESRPQWLHIELPDGQEGWVPRDATELVGQGASANTALASAVGPTSTQS